MGLLKNSHLQVLKNYWTENQNGHLDLFILTTIVLKRFDTWKLYLLIKNLIIFYQVFNVA